MPEPEAASLLHVDAAVAELITPAEREYAGALATGMAARFGVAVHDFALLAVPGPSEVSDLAVAYAAAKGIDMGDPELFIDKRRNWNALRRESSVARASVAIDGETIDTRRGMTEAVYRAMAAQVKDPRSGLPDRPYLNRAATMFWFPHTWLTGEHATRYCAPAACIDGPSDQPEIHLLRRNDGRQPVRFRPAVVYRKTA